MSNNLINKLHKLEHPTQDIIMKQVENIQNHMEYVFEELLNKFNNTYLHCGIHKKDFRRTQYWNAIGIYNKSGVIEGIENDRFQIKTLDGFTYVCTLMENYNKSNFRKKRCDQCGMKIKKWYYNVINCQYCWHLLDPIIIGYNVPPYPKNLNFVRSRFKESHFFEDF